VTDGIDDFQFYGFAGQQTQRPFPVAWGRISQTHGNDPGFLLAVQPGRSGFHGLLVIQRLLEAFQDTFLSHILDGLTAAAEGLGNPLIRPSGAICVSHQQNVGPFDFLARSLELVDHHFTLLTLLIREPHDILFLHRTPPWFEVSKPPEFPLS